MFVGSRIAERSISGIAAAASGRAQLMEVPEGRAGVEQTLKIMRAAARDACTKLPIRGAALALTAGLRPKDRIGEIKALHAFVRDQVRYVRDVDGVETIQHPLYTMNALQGDCDDKATLLCALLKSIGCGCEFVAVGFQPGSFSHVYVNAVLKDRGRVNVIPLETTEPWPAGRAPLGVKSKIRIGV